MNFTSLDMDASDWGLPEDWDMEQWRAFKKNWLDAGFDEDEIERSLGKELLIIEKFGIDAAKEKLDRMILKDRWK